MTATSPDPASPVSGFGLRCRRRILAGALVLASLAGIFGLLAHARSSVGPTGTPTPRVGTAMAYDPASRTVVMFGGFTAVAVWPGSSKPLGDTWLWDGDAWHEQQPAVSPSPRGGATMAYDPALGRVVLHGGTTSAMCCDFGPVYSDTWSWDGASWRVETSTANLVTDQVAPGRDHVAPDATDGGVLGVDLRTVPVPPPGCPDETVPSCPPPPPPSSGPTDVSTWSWKGSSWVRRGSDQALSVAGPAFLIADTGHHRELLVDSSLVVWAWQGRSWTALPARGAAPVAGVAAAAYDAARDRLVVLSDPPAGAGQITLTWDGSRWTHRAMSLPVPPPAPPTPRPSLSACGPPAYPFSLRIGGGEPGTGGATVDIGARATASATSCRATLTVTLTLQDATGRPLAIENNGLGMVVDTDVSSSDFARFLWRNWCGPQAVYNAVARVGSSTFSAPIWLSEPPRCEDRTRPSVLQGMLGAGSERVTAPQPLVGFGPSPSPSPKAGSRRPGVGIDVSGVINGRLEGAATSCQQHVPEGDAGFMTVSGTVDGAPFAVVIMSNGPAPGTPVEIYAGRAEGDVEYQQALSLTGITGFDWARGATVDIDLPPIGTSTPGTGVHVTGRIACPR